VLLKLLEFGDPAEEFFTLYNFSFYGSIETYSEMTD
jgi:hypothetical protein